MKKFWIGTSGWTYQDWSGKFYPADINKNKWLEYYAQHFNTNALLNALKLVSKYNDSQ
jgi:N-acetylmuramoyl-L-alanine amidase CwlA